MAINIYPPILANSQAAFLTSTKSYPIYFTLSNTTSLDAVKHIQIKVTYQSNSKSAINTSIYPDGIIYKDIVNVASYGTSQYYVSVSAGDLASGWTENTYYKVQLRFGSSELWTDLSSFAEWKSEQVSQNKFTEWSTVMVIKSIAEPVLTILNNSTSQSSGLVIETVMDSERTLMPLFTASYYCNSYEPENKYRFQIYQGDKASSGILVEDSGWLQHDLSKDQLNSAGPASGVDQHRFKKILTNGETYTLVYSVETINLYQSSAEDYTFIVSESYLSKLDGIILTTQDGASGNEYCNDNGCIQLYLTADHSLSGNYVLTRSSELSSYGIWEDLFYVVCSDTSFNNSLIYTDFTIESGISYKYAFQQENSMGLRTSPVYEVTSPARLTNFEYSYLFNNNIQLKLKFDNSMSSFKRTTLNSKQDTLGSKYPTVFRNSSAYYAEFPVTGLISLHMDEEETFFVKKENGYYYQDELIIPSNKYAKTVVGTTAVAGGITTELIDTYDTNLTDDNIFIERKFREKVEEFLNNGEYKLFKSPTEGNIIVTLVNVSLSPNATLGRMIYSFSATAYEVLENNIPNLNEYGLIDIGQFKEIINDEQTALFGQISGLYTGEYSKDVDGRFTVKTNPFNLINEIVNNNTYDIGGGYQYSFSSLSSIWVEQYPKLAFNSELNELQAKKIAAETSGDTEAVAAINLELNRINALIDEINNSPTYPSIIFNINGQEIALGPNRVYHIEDLNLTSADSIYLKYTGAVLLNYTCKVNSIESVSETVSAVVTSSVWNQLEGIFTETTDILNNYDYYRDPNKYLVSKDYNISLYQSLNILDIIKNNVKDTIAESYNTEFTEYDEETGQWTDGKIYYNFEDLTMVEIEADRNTVLLLKNTEDNITQRIIIGPTEKYVLKNISNMILELAFEAPTYSIINYRCSTTQMTKG